MLIVRTKMAIEPLPKRLWKLLEPMQYVWEGKVYTVPKGFPFDGASIPRLARIVIPKNGVKLYAACLHDYFYRTHEVTRENADRAFLNILLEMGEPKPSAYLMYYAVRAGGWKAWK